MVPESSSISFSGDDFEFDIDFEFDAPRFYDFSRPELGSETEEIETWFQSSGNYPPSPFSPKFNWKFEPFKQITNTISDSKPVEIIESLDTDTDTGLNRKDKFNGFIYYNQTVKDVSNTKSKSKTKPSDSTLTRPTASLLARQNKPLDIYSVQLLTRCQRSLAKFGENVSPILVSKLQNQDTKRQRMEAKVAHVSRRTKLTVPKEPNLRTAERSERHRSKVNSETEQNAKSSSNSSKRQTWNKNINLEPSSRSLPKSNTPLSKDLQAFRLRTSLRAKERSSNAKTDVIQENDATNSRTLKHIDSSKTRIVKENHSRKINCQVYESKTSLLDLKRSSKEELGEAIRIEYGNQSSCRTDINRSLDLCRKFDSQEVARNLITA
ncbi:TPX2 central domain [Arabidopsis thaliana x Arabidopsis arenosa]|uniref:TPX2 central domain n=1 Tax=Arabidopsis thaliana x Arabidopsis arenosa TaxID=1240361 RepID=A0A8T1XKT3_9BRAS|nr:TPX2 central domain [Arabidopsis thaliana x Arabidopsis arenosa]